MRFSVSMRMPVSIRAPARGATWWQYRAGKPMTVSIRAPARGATIQAGDKAAQERSFNSRSREGSDTWRTYNAYRQRVSIRAPARGATSGIPSRW